MRGHVQRMIQELLEEEVTEFLGRAKSARRSESDLPRRWPTQSRLGPAASHSIPGLTASLQLTQRPRNLAPPRSRESPAA